MGSYNNLIPLREYCRQYDWPRLTQWNNWIYTQAAIAQCCIKKIGGRYLIDLDAFHTFVSHASLDEPQQKKEPKL